MFPLPNLQLAAFVTDTTGNWGCGAYWGQEWFQLKCSQMLAGAHISAKELSLSDSNMGKILEEYEGANLFR